LLSGENINEFSVLNPYFIEFNLFKKLFYFQNKINFERDKK